MRTKIELILLIIAFFPFVISAQGESNNWYFGFGAGLRFDNSGAVQVTNGGQTMASEGVASISSRKGELLFYTDGRTIFNRNHVVMGNGDNLFGEGGSTQSAVIVPLPKNPNRYYVFTVDATSESGVRGRGLNYSIVDMSLDNGNGAVIEKNTNLLEDCTEKLAVVIGDCANEMLWIVTIATPTGTWNLTPPFPVFNTYHAFKMDATGVAQTSVASTFPIYTQFDQGYIKFSQDGSKLANAHAQDGLFLGDFDRNTGMVSNLRLIPITGTLNIEPYGLEFSPNSQYLYVHTFRKRPGVFVYDSSLLQYDTLAADISGSQVIIEERGLFRGALQLGTNGKIYRTLTVDFTNGYIEGTPIESDSSYLGVINNPNEKGVACNYEHNAIEIQGNRVRQGLPPLVQSFFTEASLAGSDDIVIDGNLAACIGEALVIEVQNIPGATYTWEKDNSPLASAQTNSIKLDNVSTADTGEYKVTIIRPNALDCPINGEIEVVLYEKPMTNDLLLTVCDLGDDNAMDGKTETNLEQVLVVSDLVYSFYSSTANLLSNLPITEPGNYVNIVPYEEILYYKAVNAAGCENSGELTLKVREVPDIILEEKYLLCTDQPALIIAGSDGFDTYNWIRVDSGRKEIVSNEKDFNVLSEGNYLLEASIVTTNNGVETTCPIVKEFEVLPSKSAVIDEIKVERFTDNDTKVEIVVTGNGDYEFSWDGSIYQDANILENVNAGNVTFSVRDKNGCGVVTETVEVMPDTSSGFPNFFTPNNDGTNDVWQVLPAPQGEELNIMEIRIFNRYGQLLAQIDPHLGGWDGNFNGKPLPASDYWYRATKLDGQKIRGHFTLKR